MKWVYQKNDVMMHSAGNGSQPGVIVAAYLIPVWKGNILLARRFRTGYEDGKYSLVAGHVEQGESCMQCIVREAKEEIGVMIRMEDLEMVHVMHHNAGVNNQRMHVFFVTTTWKGAIANCEPHKCDDLAWYDFERLPQNTIPYVAYAIRQIINDVSYSEYGW